MDNSEENKIISGAGSHSVPQAHSDASVVATLPKEEKKTFFAPKDRTKNTRKTGGREHRVKPEFDQKLINIRRVARVVAGGRRFSFSVAVIAGNRKGLVGVGMGKAGDTALAIDKAVRNAKKNMINVRLTKTMSIPHEVECKFSSARIIIRPARGKGVIAGSVARYVIDLAGIKDVSAKILSVSKNQLNIARATIAALEKISKPNISKTPALSEDKKVSAKESAEKSK